MVVGRTLLALQLYYILCSITVPLCLGTVSSLFLEIYELSNEFVWQPNILTRQEVLMKLVRIDYLVKQRCNSKASLIHHGISLNKYLTTTILLLSNDVQVNPGPSTPCTTRNGTVMDGNLNSAAINSPLKRVKGLKMVNLNVRSLLKNIDELRSFVCANKLDILTLSKSWLDCLISNNEITIENYNLECHDRNRNGGGTAIYIHERFSLNNNDLDMVLCSLKLQRSRPLIIGSIYHPPSDSNFYSNFMNLLDEMDLVNSELYLLGDFNCRIKSAK